MDMRSAGLAGGAIGAVALVATGAMMSGATAKGRLHWQDAAVVSRGQDIYAEYCAECHGSTMAGQPGWRSRRADGNLPAPPHDESGHTWHHPDDMLFDLTKYGPAAMIGGGYQSDMPGFGGVLSDEDIEAVLAYIKASWPEEIRRAHDEINARAPSR